MNFSLRFRESIQIRDWFDGNFIDNYIFDFSFEDEVTLDSVTEIKDEGWFLDGVNISNIVNLFFILVCNCSDVLLSLDLGRDVKLLDLYLP